MKIEKFELYPIALKLKQPFKTAQGLTTHRPITLVKVILNNKMSGIGEVQSFADAKYAAETQVISQETLAEMLPQLIGLEFNHPIEVVNILSKLTSYSFAKAAVEMALYDVYGKVTNQSLQKMIGGCGTTVKIGRAIGLQNDYWSLESKIDNYVNEGYQRIKLKIDRNTDLVKLARITRQYPEIYFSLDANASWQRKDIDKIKTLDEMGIALLEQPFAADELALHYQVQQVLPQLKLSLDESINCLADVFELLTKYKQPITRAVTIKQGKIGGITVATEAIITTKQAAVQPWIGGMLTSGIGRAVDLALSSLPAIDNFPGDNGNNEAYFEKDIIKQDLVVRNGRMQVPQMAGLGISVDWPQINALLIAPIITY